MNVDQYFLELDANTAEVLQVLREVKGHETPAPQGQAWRPLQVAEHILLTETLVRNLLTRPSDIIHDSTEIMGQEKMRRILVDLRDRKVKAPASLEPTGQFTSSQMAADAVLHSRTELKADLLEGRIQVSNAVYKHPMLGEMTVRDWLYFVIHHSQRHLLQLRELVARQ